MQDKIMILLFLMGVFSLVIELATSEHPKYAWIEGFAIILAVFIVILVTGVNDYQKEKKFEELQNVHSKRQQTNVIRNGQLVALHPSLLQVGDLIEVEGGDIIPADGVLISADRFEVDESSITGENEKLLKAGFNEVLEVLEKFLNEGLKPTGNDLPSAVCISGTTVAEGRGKLVVLAIGKFSVEGQIIEMTSSEPESTPLELKLNDVAELISKIGLICAGIAVSVMYLRLLIEVLVGTLD